MDYSDELIRGVPNDAFLEDGLPKSELFKNFDENSEREDDYLELSINWYDNENALQLVHTQKKANGEIQFKSGGAVISRKDLDDLCKKPLVKGKLTYERRIVEGNEYHGNLLLQNDVNKTKRNIIASGLALCVNRVENCTSSADSE